MKQITKDVLVRMIDVLDKGGVDDLNDREDVFESEGFKNTMVELAKIISRDKEEFEEVKKYFDRVYKYFFGDLAKS